MKLPIPHDWNGKDWLCLQVQWPDSIEYRALLAGFLSYLGRGRAYDEKTGTITTAQEIGWEIFNRNMPMHACVGQNQPEQPNIGELPCDWCYEGVNEECGDMGCCIDALEWRNGELWYRMCGKWDKVEGGQGLLVLPTDGDSVVETTDPATQENWACSKAKIIGDMVWLTAASLLAHGDDADIWNIVGNVEEDTGLDLIDANVFATVVTWSLIDLAIDMQDVLTDGNKQEFICRLAKVLDGSNNDLGDNQFSQIADVAKQVAAGSPLARAFLVSVVACIGLQEFRKYTRLAVLTEQDCTCPEVEVPIIPSGYTWAHYYDFMLVDDFDWLGIGSTVYQLGEGFTANVSAYGDTIAACSKAATTPLVESRLTFWRVEYGDWPISDENSGYWAKVVPDALSTDMSLYGNQFISGTTNKLIGQGVVLEFGNVQCFENPAIGGPSSLRGLWIAGTGADPFPGDPVYTP